MTLNSNAPTNAPIPQPIVVDLFIHIWFVFPLFIDTTVGLLVAIYFLTKDFIPRYGFPESDKMLLLFKYLLSIQNEMMRI